METVPVRLAAEGQPADSIRNARRARQPRSAEGEVPDPVVNEALRRVRAQRPQGGAR